MKKYLIFIIILSASCSKNMAQTANNKQGYRSLKEMNYDTLNYIKTSFIARKSYYANKEFNVLLNDLEIPINNFMMGMGYYKATSPNISLEFFSENKVELKEQKKIDPIIMGIKWETPLPYDSVVTLMKKNRGAWTNEHKKYFGKQKVKDIDIVRYNFQ